MTSVYNRNDRGALRQAQGLTRRRPIRGITMAEVDDYYEGLLQEIKELKKLLKEDGDGQKTSQEDNQGV